VTHKLTHNGLRSVVRAMGYGMKEIRRLYIEEIEEGKGDGFAARHTWQPIYDLAAEYGTKEEVIRIAKVAPYRPFITRLTPATISRIDAEDTRPPSL
jgi:hypothetical protein